MSGREAKEKLLENMQAEYDAFRRKIEKMSGKEAITFSFENISKQDILYALEENALDEKQILALLRLPNPLETCYRRWLHTETDYMESVASVLRQTADCEIQHQNRECRRKEHGEVIR